MPGALEHFGYAGLFGMLLLGGLGLPIPEDVPLLIAGYLIHQGTFRWWRAVPVALTGVITADSLIYALGVQSRRRLAQPPAWIPVSTERLEWVRGHFARHGVLTVMGARFAPGLRLLAHWSAGSFGMSYSRFLLGDVAAALVSVPAWISLGYLGARQLDRVLRGVAAAEHVVGAIAFLLLLAGGAYVWYRNRFHPSGKTS